MALLDRGKALTELMPLTTLKAHREDVQQTLPGHLAAGVSSSQPVNSLVCPALWVRYHYPAPSTSCSLRPRRQQAVTEHPGHRPRALVIPRVLHCKQGSLAAPTLGKALQDKASLVFHFPLITCPFSPQERRRELCQRRSSKMHFSFVRHVSAVTNPAAVTVTCCILLPITG